MKCGVYKIISPSGKVYIGSSINIDRRFRDYRRLNCKSQTKLYNSFMKYGVQNHIFHIIELCDESELLDKERYYGEEENVIIEGLNLYLPKSGDLKRATSSETKIKLSLLNTGKSLSDSTKKKLSLKNSGDSNPMYGLKGHYHPAFGKKKSEEVRLTISKKHKGKKLSKETKDKISKNNGKGRSKIVLDFSTGIFYNSASELALLRAINPIVLRSKLGGFIFNNTSFAYV